MRRFNWACPTCGAATHSKEALVRSSEKSCSCDSALWVASDMPRCVAKLQEEKAALRAERATLSNGLMIQTDQVEHSEKVIEELEKVAEHAAALFYNHELTETWDALEEALRSAGYLKEDGDE